MTDLAWPVVKIDPEGGVQVSDAIPQPSVAFGAGEYVTAVYVVFGERFMTVGHVIFGGPDA